MKMHPKTELAGERILKLIQVKGLTVRFGSATILKNISFDLDEGEIFGIVGKSGSGKTTLLNTLIGFIEPASGDILYKPLQIIRTREDTAQFKSISSEPEEVKKTFGFSTQIPSFYPKLSVRENLDYFGVLFGLPKLVLETNIDTLLDLVGLTDAKDALSEHLSGGMQKRLDIACALIHNPHILLLDEPTADLDPILRKQMWYLIKRINQRGTTVILASHFLEELEMLCDRIAILHNSQIMYLGSPAEIKRNYSKSEIVRIETRSGDYTGIIEELRKRFSLLNIFTQASELVIVIPEEPESGKKGAEVGYPAIEDILQSLLDTVRKNNEHLFRIEVGGLSMNEIFEALVTRGETE